jgi:PAS domain S-box-containing protein
MNAVSDIIFELDQHGKILFLSEAWARTLGYSIDQSLGRNLFEWMAPDRRERLAQELEQYLMGPAQKYHTNGSIETARGEWRAIELRYSMVRRDDQNNARIVGTLTDIQDQVKAEAALEETEQKFEQIWEHAVTGLYQVDLDGRLRSANPAMARIFGFESPSAMMATITDMQQELFPSARARQECLQTLKLEGHITNIESQARTRDGRLIWVLENARTVKNGLGKIVYYEGSLDDITERKNAEFALKDAMHESELANRSKTEFLANMSHELRTPLNSIIGFSEIIKDQVLGPVDQPQYLEYARDIHDSGTRLLSIISTILDVAKIEAGDRPLNETLFDVRGALEAVRDLVQSRVDQNAQELVIEIAPGLPRLLAEELAFKQMVLNLVTNAIKFTATGGRIHIQARREETGNFRLNVNDTGIGLDDEEIARLTAPFGQVSGNFARTSSGPGLGLTLVNSLVKLHGGHFEIVSRKGIGTTVSIILPASRLVYG